MNKSAYELIKWITAVKLEIPSIEVPFMCLHGSEDKIALSITEWSKALFTGFYYQISTK